MSIYQIWIFMKQYSADVISIVDLMSSPVQQKKTSPAGPTPCERYELEYGRVVFVARWLSPSHLQPRARKAQQGTFRIEGYF